MITGGDEDVGDGRCVRTGMRGILAAYREGCVRSHQHNRKHGATRLHKPGGRQHMNDALDDDTATRENGEHAPTTLTA